MRVALRRLRAALAMFKRACLAPNLMFSALKQNASHGSGPCAGCGLSCYSASAIRCTVLVKPAPLVIESVGASVSSV